MASTRMSDEADQVNTSICPGISIMNIFFCSGFYFILFSILLMISSGCERYKLRAVRMAPFGPSLYYFMTLFKWIWYLFVFVCLSDIDERFVGYDLDCWIEVDRMDEWWLLIHSLENKEGFTLTKVVFPVPDMPMTMRQMEFLSYSWCGASYFMTWYCFESITNWYG